MTYPNDKNSSEFVLESRHDAVFAYPIFPIASVNGFFEGSANLLRVFGIGNAVVEKGENAARYLWVKFAKFLLCGGANSTLHAIFPQDFLNWRCLGLSRADFNQALLRKI